MYHLNDREIEAKKADIDKIILNTALKLVFSFGFKKDRICSMQIKDAFDGTDLLPEIIVDPNKSRSISTAGDIRAILEPYISYLHEKYSVEPQEPLFPEYYDDRGKKNLQRHTEKYSLYRDLHKLSAESIRYYHDMFAKQGMNAQSIVKAVKDRLGKGERTIKDTLKKSKPASIATRPASIPTRQEISERSAEMARRKREREETAKDANLSDNYVPEQPISLEGKFPGSDDVRDKSIMPESQNVPHEYSSGENNHLLGILPQAVSEYFNKIHSEGIPTPKYSFGYSPSGDKYSRSLSYVEYNPYGEDRRQGRDLYFEKQEYERKAENEFNYLQVLKNLVDIIRHTGMFSNELVRLTIGDVIKPQFFNIIRSRDIEPDWIVDEMIPVNAPYKKEFSALPIRVNNEARLALSTHIGYLKQISSTLAAFHWAAFLYPCRITQITSALLFNREDFPSSKSIRILCDAIKSDFPLGSPITVYRRIRHLYENLHSMLSKRNAASLNKLLRFANFYELLMSSQRHVRLDGDMVKLASKTKPCRKKYFDRIEMEGYFDINETFDKMFPPRSFIQTAGTKAFQNTIGVEETKDEKSIATLNRRLLEELYPTMVPKLELIHMRRENDFFERKTRRFWKDLIDNRLTDHKTYEDLREDGICEYCWNLHKEALPEDIIVRQVMRHGRYSKKSEAEEILKTVKARGWTL